MVPTKIVYFKRETLRHSIIPNWFSWSIFLFELGFTNMFFRGEWCWMRAKYSYCYISAYQLPPKPWDGLLGWSHVLPLSCVSLHRSFVCSACIQLVSMIIYIKYWKTPVVNYTQRVFSIFFWNARLKSCYVNAAALTFSDQNIYNFRALLSISVRTSLLSCVSTCLLTMKTRDLFYWHLPIFL